MPNSNIKIPSGLSLDDTLSVLGYATSLQEKLFQAKNPQTSQQEPMDGQQSPTNAPGQEMEGGMENTAEGGKEEPKSDLKAKKLPEDSGFQSKVLDELASLKAEVESLMKDEETEKQEESTETNDSNDAGEKE